jgi:hypothetical protein
MYQTMLVASPLREMVRQEDGGCLEMNERGWRGSILLCISLIMMMSPSHFYMTRQMWDWTSSDWYALYERQFVDSRSVAPLFVWRIALEVQWILIPAFVQFQEPSIIKMTYNLKDLTITQITQGYYCKLEAMT